MLMLAELEDRAGATARAAELLREVLGDDPGNLSAARTLAQILLDDGSLDEAARVVANAASRAESGELAELAGEIRMAQGRYAEAVAMFGPRASLSSRGRRLRRRSWWRSGGPFRPRSGRDAAPTSAAGTGMQAHPSDPPDAALETITWATWLSDQDRHDDARQVISEALAAYGRHPSLLACAAKIEDSADAVNSALYLWREAYRAAPQDIDVVCGLAMCLTFVLVQPSNTWQVSDALRVLECFPDQSHAEIRTARADVLSSNHSSAARVVAAYGRPGDLSGAAARTRRRLWWRSAGPFGQLSFRVADRIRGKRRAPHQIQPVPRTEAESEAVARVLDSIGELPPSDARERIEQAWQQHGRQPSLLLAYADAADSDRASWQGLVVAAEAARSSPDSLDAVCALAWALDGAYGYGTALQAIESLSAEARQTVEARVLAGDLHRWARNFAIAVPAYGDPRDLGRYDRKSRRYCVRRALLQPVRASSRDDVDAIDPSSFDPMPLGIAQVLDRAATLTDEPARMRELAKAAIEEHGRHPQLLLVLAESERLYGDRHAGAAMAAEVMGAAPKDPFIVARAIRELWLADYDADALRAITDLFDQLNSSPAIRGTAGDIYRYWRLRANVVTAFGRSGLEAWRWRMRRACWWLTGGPAGRIRSSIEAREDPLLSDLALPASQAVALSVLPLPDPVAAAARGDLATHQMIRAYWTVFRPGILSDWLDRAIGPVSTLIVFAALTLAEHLRWPSAGIARNLIAAAIATAAEAAALWILVKMTTRWATRIGAAAACGGGMRVLAAQPRAMGIRRRSGAGCAGAGDRCCVHPDADRRFRLAHTDSTLAARRSGDRRTGCPA